MSEQLRSPDQEEDTKAENAMQIEQSIHWGLIRQVMGLIERKSRGEAIWLVHEVGRTSSRALIDDIVKKAKPGNEGRAFRAGTARATEHFNELKFQATRDREALAAVLQDWDPQHLYTSADPRREHPALRAMRSFFLAAAEQLRSERYTGRKKEAFEEQSTAAFNDILHSSNGILQGIASAAHKNAGKRIQSFSTELKAIERRLQPKDKDSEEVRRGTIEDPEVQERRRRVDEELSRR